MIELLMWAVAAVSLTGVVANLHKKRWGFACWMGTNAVWVVYDWHKTAYPQAALMAIYFCLAVWGWFKWGAKARVPARSFDNWEYRKFSVGRCFPDTKGGYANYIVGVGFDIMGFISYSRVYEQYVFEPDPLTAWPAGWLTDIQDALDRAEKIRKDRS